MTFRAEQGGFEVWSAHILQADIFFTPSTTMVWVAASCIQSKCVYHTRFTLLQCVYDILHVTFTKLQWGSVSTYASSTVLFSSKRTASIGSCEVQ